MLFNPPSVDLSIKAGNNILHNTGNGCRNSHLILSCFMQPGPGQVTMVDIEIFATSAEIKGLEGHVVSVV